MRHEPAEPAVPLVCDSPHSGRLYPADFRPAAPMRALRRTEDAFVDELWGDAPALGATLIAAQFPRVYIDANRSLADLDPSMVEGEYPGAMGGEKSARGIGLIWRQVPPDVEIYDRRLTPSEVRHRIDAYWRPYQEAVATALADTYRRFGAAWHLNCHSMPSRGDVSAGDPGRRRADFVLGDLDGTSCAPEFTALVEDTLGRLGYGVVRNDPFKGVELVRRHGAPAAGRHSLQVEVNRALYMNETTGEKLAAFARLAADITTLLRAVCDYARAAGSTARTAP